MDPGNCAYHQSARFTLDSSVRWRDAGSKVYSNVSYKDVEVGRRRGGEIG